MRNARLVSARFLTSFVRELTLDPGPGFSFTPGQWVSFRIPTSSPDPITRAYSIASGPRADGLFQVAVTRIESGPGSGYLHQLPLGESVEISHAQGFFALQEALHPILMIATGTGISPFRSMLEGLVASGKTLPQTTVLLGVRSESDILYAEEFRSLNAKLVPSLSRPNSDWQGLRGHVQEHLAHLLVEHGPNCDIYVCGLNRMVKDVRAILRDSLGVDREHIHTERYD